MLLKQLKQFVSCGKENTSLETIRFSVPQGSILGPLLFLILVNDLQYPTNVLNPIIFADDTSFFSSHSNIKDLFEIANKEMKNVFA